MPFYTVFHSPVGDLFIGEEASKITFIALQKKEGFQKKESQLLKSACQQLQSYFEGTLKTFDLPLNPQGTDFQQNVWKALTQIPYGETKSYKQIAMAVGNNKACRAVGMANNHNPIMIVIPCHRVIGADGSLTGYAGGLEIKKQLLDLERKQL